MRTPQTDGWTRRRFLGGLTVAGTVGLLGLPARPVAAEPPPETRRLRLAQTRAVCAAPEYIAEEFLRGEGFTEVQYTTLHAGLDHYQALASGKVDLSIYTVGALTLQVDAGNPVVALAGLHVGCYELFGTDRVHAIRDLKGKTVAVPQLGDARHVLVAAMTAYVGLDPRTDLTFVAHPPAEAMRLLAEEKIDAFMSFPPDPQEMRAKQIGHVVVNTALDRPWAQYFCCLVNGNQAFVRQHPVATKRALRAILKATDLCALEPDRAAQAMVDRGLTPRFDYAVQALQEIPYTKWREYDPEDTVRFFALRLHEVGMIKSTPQQIIARGTDWRFLNELKKELKG
jgi:NitT/TauT family transport system substrate-binding protein